MLQAHFPTISRYSKSRVVYFVDAFISNISNKSFVSQSELHDGQYECKDISFLLHAWRNCTINASEIKCEKTEKWDVSILFNLSLFQYL